MPGQTLPVPPLNAHAWELKQTDKNVFRIAVPMDAQTHTQELAFLSDAHIDNPDCDRERLKRFFDICAARNTPIICVGDWFCAMQSKGDKRSSKSKIEAYNGQSYFDRLVNDSFDFLAPYAHLLAVWGEGNHETAITNRHETDLIERLCHRLRVEAGSQVLKAPYRFWVLLRQFRKSHRNGFGELYRICLRHSGGSRGQVTKGTLSVARTAATYHGAHLYVSGDTHVGWTIPSVQIHVDQLGREVQTPAQYLKLGCWKDEHSGGGGWWNETDKDPITLGGAFVAVTVRKDRIQSHEIRHESAPHARETLTRHHTKHFRDEHA